jgi:hypothetical protein
LKVNHPTVENLTAAANFLVNSTRCTRIVNEINNFIASWNDSPKMYVGELEVLNPLIRLGVDHREKYDAILERVYAARQQVAEQRRVDYQKDLMRRIRAREANAVTLAEWVRGRRFLPDERAEFIREQKRQWDEAKAEFVRRHAADSSQTRGASATFWNLTDMELEEELKSAKLNNAPPLPAKRITNDEPEMA